MTLSLSTAVLLMYQNVLIILIICIGLSISTLINSSKCMMFLKKCINT